MQKKLKFCLEKIFKKFIRKWYFRFYLKTKNKTRIGKFSFQNSNQTSLDLICVVFQKTWPIIHDLVFNFKKFSGPLNWIKSTVKLENYILNMTPFIFYALMFIITLIGMIWWIDIFNFEMLLKFNLKYWIPGI